MQAFTLQLWLLCQDIRKIDRRLATGAGLVVTCGLMAAAQPPADKMCTIPLLMQQTSVAKCVHGKSFGCTPNGTGIWVIGCRGAFRCDNNVTFDCGYPPGLEAYTCSCTRAGYEESELSDWLVKKWSRVQTRRARAATRMALRIPPSARLSDSSPRSMSNMNATSLLCVVLHMCWRERLLHDYQYAAQKWDRAAASHPTLEVYFVDSCRNLSEPHPFETRLLRRIPFQQRQVPQARFWLTSVEMDQVAAALVLLPPRCTHVVKLTGKYFSHSLPPYLERLAAEAPMLALQARGPSWQGWSSELYIMSRRLLAAAMRTRSSFTSTEEWLEHVRTTLSALKVRVHRLPRFDLDRPVQRSGDFKLMTWL